MKEIIEKIISEYLIYFLLILLVISVSVGLVANLDKIRNGDKTIRDEGIMGMYVEQVADFMEKYSTEMENEVVKNTVTEIGEAVPNRLVGGVLSSVGNLFKNKRLKNKDRVELINDHQVFLVNR